MTRDDLEDILSFDGVAAVCGGIGIFLLSGAGWLIVESAFGDDGFTLNSLMSFCIAAAGFGALSLVGGLYFNHQKRGRIKRIFNQTKRN